MVAGRPLSTLLLVALVTALFAAQLPKLRSETDVTAFLPRGDESVINLDLLEEIFGSPYLWQILILREDHPDGVYNPETLGVIGEITAWLQSRPEFETSRNSDLRSLRTVNDILGDDSGMVVEPFFDEVPANRAQALAVRRAVERNGIYVGMLAAADARGAAIIVRESAEGERHREQAYRDLMDYLSHFRADGRPEEFHVTGRPAIQGLFGIYIAEEGQRLLPYVFGLLILFLFLSFRSLRGVLLPVIVIAGTEVWMLGFLALWGHPVYTITSILPILIVSIAVAASIHVIARYYEAAQDKPGAGSRELVQYTLTEITPPVLMTSLTTAVGFLAMASSKQVPMADFGVVAAAGILSSLVLTLTIVPALLAIFPAGTGKLRRRTDDSLPLGWMLARSTATADRNAKGTLALFSALLVLGLCGVSRLTTNTSMVREFPPGHDIRVADEAANRHFSGGTVLDLIVDGSAPGAIKSPNLLKRIDRLQRELERIDGVGDTFSLAELIKQMNRVMNEDRADAYRIPDEHDLVAQYLLLYSMSGDPGDFDDLVDYDYRYAHVTVFLRDSRSSLARRVERRLQELIPALFPPGSEPPVSVRTAGTANITVHLEDYVVHSQIVTLANCIAALLPLMWLYGRRQQLRPGRRLLMGHAPASGGDSVAWASDAVACSVPPGSVETRISLPSEILRYHWAES